MPSRESRPFEIAFKAREPFYEAGGQQEIIIFVISSSVFSTQKEGLRGNRAHVRAVPILNVRFSTLSCAVFTSLINASSNLPRVLPFFVIIFANGVNRPACRRR